MHVHYTHIHVVLKASRHHGHRWNWFQWATMWSGISKSNLECRHHLHSGHTIDLAFPWRHQRDSINTRRHCCLTRSVNNPSAHAIGRTNAYPSVQRPSTVPEATNTCASVHVICTPYARVGQFLNNAQLHSHSRYNCMFCILYKWAASISLITV